MRAEFKNRGHFCNYCRKVLFNKCPDYYHHTINQAIWHVWNTGDPKVMDSFLKDLVAVEPKKKTRHFNAQLKKIKDKYVERSEPDEMAL